MRQSKRRRQQEQRERDTSYGNLRLDYLESKTRNQATAMQQFRAGNNCIFKGSAGVGKTYLALALALETVVEQEQYSRIIILRSARQGVDQGHMPGDGKEKGSYYENAYKETVNKLFDDQTAYEKLKARATIVFETTSFLRGLNFDDAVVILDEAQNCSRSELHTVATRMGPNSQLIILGDKAQVDYMKNEKSGFEWFCNILRRVPNVSTVEFTALDVVRSGFVKDYLLAFESDYEDQQERTVRRFAAV